MSPLSMGKHKAKQQLMMNPVAPCMETYWVSRQESAEGIVAASVGAKA